MPGRPLLRLRDLSPLDALRVLWWRVGLTPTARLRSERLDQSLRDQRGRAESLRIARCCAA